MCFTKIDRYIETCMKQMQESVDLVSGRQIEQKFSPSGVGKKYILYYNIWIIIQTMDLIFSNGKYLKARKI